MKRYEISIKILNKKYVDSLIISLARQGYAPYISYDGQSVCFTVSEEETEIEEIKYAKINK